MTQISPSEPVFDTHEEALLYQLRLRLREAAKIANQLDLVVLRCKKEVK
jgi:hypothetical protein